MLITQLYILNSNFCWRKNEIYLYEDGLFVDFELNNLLINCVKEDYIIFVCLVKNYYTYGNMSPIDM